MPLSSTSCSSIDPLSDQILWDHVDQIPRVLHSDRVRLAPLMTD